MCLFLANFLRSFDVWVWSGLWRRRFLMALCLDVCSLHRTSCHSKEASILRETSRHFSQKKEEEGIAHHRKSWACCGAVKSYFCLYFCIASHIIIFMISCIWSTSKFPWTLSYGTSRTADRTEIPFLMRQKSRDKLTIFNWRRSWMKS